MVSIQNGYLKSSINKKCWIGSTDERSKNTEVKSKPYLRRHIQMVNCSRHEERGK